MNFLKTVLRSRLYLLFTLLAIFTVVFDTPEAAAWPPSYCDYTQYGNVHYYSDATYTTLVGTCWKTCVRCYWTCYGQMTQYQVDDIHTCELDPYGN